MKTSNSVLKYDRFTVDINFPAGYACCDLCPLMETYARKQCRWNGNYLLDTRVIDWRCPLKPKEDENGDLE